MQLTSVSEHKRVRKVARVHLSSSAVVAYCLLPFAAASATFAIAIAITITGAEATK